MRQSCMPIAHAMPRRHRWVVVALLSLVPVPNARSDKLEAPPRGYRRIPFVHRATTSVTLGHDVHKSDINTMCACTCVNVSSTGFTVHCANLPDSDAYQVTLARQASSTRPFAAITTTPTTQSASQHEQPARENAHAAVDLTHRLVADTTYWVRVAVHDRASGPDGDITRGWLPPCAPPIACRPLPTPSTPSEHRRGRPWGVKANKAVAPPLMNESPRPLQRVNVATETLEVFRMTELWGLKNDSGLAPPSSAIDFLLSHDSADVFGAAFLYTLSNGFPANQDPLHPGRNVPASGPLPFSPLNGAPIAVYSVNALLMNPKDVHGPTGGYARYVSCESTRPPQCFCTSAVDRIIAYEPASEVYRDCPPDASHAQHGCNCTPYTAPAFFGPPYPGSDVYVGRQPIYNTPPVSTAPVPTVPPGTTQRGWWYSTPSAGRCNQTAQQPHNGGCTWSRDPLVRLVWPGDLRLVGYDFSTLACNVWTCLPDDAQRAAAMIEANSRALRRAVDALPLAPL
eukprot:m.3922 g.3922  ORF g.3922 m.3922 type:complete len:512 (-) comp1030_c0_seq1:65-1600(-)